MAKAGGGGAAMAGAQIDDRPELLAAMVADGAAAGPLWRPTAYWRPYCRRVQRELDRHGLAGVRRNYRLLKGYAVGGAPEPTLPEAAWKRAVWRAVARLPVVERIIGEYRRLVAAEHRRHVRDRVLLARLVLDQLAEALPALAPPQGIDAGGPEDAFEWRGHRVSARWVYALCQLADFYAVIAPDSVRGIVEVGPGLGLSTLAHLAANPALETVVNCDIPPILYVSTQFLRATGAVRVVDYLDVRHQAAIELEGGRPPVVYQLPPWRLADVRGELQAAFNSFSFQEMERDVCRNYAATLGDMVSGTVMLHATVRGRSPGAGGQAQPINMAFLRDAFAEPFGRRIALPGLWAKLYGREPESALLLAREPFAPSTARAGVDTS